MRIAVVTSGRQDWGILRSTCVGLAADDRFDLRLFAGGMHTAAELGRTIDLMREEGFAIAEELDWITGRPSPAAQAAAALEQIASALDRHGPDAMLVAGDRFETAAAALAATLVRVPIVHLHGGEQTEGAIDDALRHAITKLSHLHLVSHPDHARRVIALGEAAGSVQVVGAPGLDNLWRSDLPDRAELAAALGIELSPPVVLVTVHPATLAAEPLADVSAVTAAMDRVDATYVITLPNVDPGHAELRERLRAAAVGPRRVAVEALGERRYWGLLRVADAILGNSSSALLEAPAVELPAVNVGDRQKGRLRGANVVDVAPEPAAVERALAEALSPPTRARLRGTHSPYGDGRAGERIVAALAAWAPPSPPRKPGIPV